MRKENNTDREAILKDEDVQLFKIMLQRLKSRYDISGSDILNQIQDEVYVPCSIFNKDLSPLETEVKYLKENLYMKYNKIAKMLRRSQKTGWQAYKNAHKKYPEHLTFKESDYNIPMSVFSTELSILESVVKYLKENYKLNYNQIGKILKRDQRTIWTVYNRAMKKTGGSRKLTLNNS